MSAGTLYLFLAALFGASGVVLGAFGAHGLKARLGAAGVDTWETAVLYHLIHALALLGAGLWLKLAALAGEAAPTGLGPAGAGFVLGILLFSGSLYVLALGGPRWLGPVTPLGGVAFIAGWLLLAWAALRSGVTS